MARETSARCATASMLNRPGSAETSSSRAAAIIRARVSSIATWRWPSRYGRGLIGGILRFAQYSFG